MGALSLACAPNTTLLRPPALQGRGVQQGCQTQSPLGAEMRLAACLGLAPADVQDNGSPDPGAPVRVGGPAHSAGAPVEPAEPFLGPQPPADTRGSPHSSIRPPTLSAHQGREAGAGGCRGRESSGIPGGAEGSARPWSAALWCPHHCVTPPWHRPRPVLKGHRGWRAQTCTSLQGVCEAAPSTSRPRPRPSGNPALPAGSG